jgi:hypothetical protein
MKYLWYLLLSVWILTGCKKDEPIIDPRIEIQFQNVVGSDPLVLNASKYLSPTNDTFNVSQFKYYVSNVILSSKEGKNYVEPQSYHLISQEGKLAFKLNSIPPYGTYDTFTFSIGVDSSHNHTLVATGDLDPNTNMAWDWNTGYKFLLLEGDYATLSKKGGLIFHIGQDANYKTITLNGTITVANGKKTIIKIKSDINEMFINPNTIDFNVLHEAMFGSEAAKIADNYANGMFTISSIINP